MTEKHIADEGARQKPTRPNKWRGNRQSIWKRIQNNDSKDVEKNIKFPTSNSIDYFKRLGEFKPEHRNCWELEKLGIDTQGAYFKWKLVLAEIFLLMEGKVMASVLLSLILWSQGMEVKPHQGKNRILQTAVDHLEICLVLGPLNLSLYKFKYL